MVGRSSRRSRQKPPAGGDAAAGRAESKVGVRPPQAETNARKRPGSNPGVLHARPGRTTCMGTAIEPATSPHPANIHARAEWCLRVNEMLSGDAPRDDGIILDHAMTLAQEIAHRQHRKYRWIDPEDLQQELLMRLPQWIDRFDPRHQSATTWSKYLFWKMTLYVKDVLRREDPLGISWPQRKRYPAWFRLGEQSGKLAGGVTPRPPRRATKAVTTRPMPWNRVTVATRSSRPASKPSGKATCWACSVWPARTEPNLDHLGRR